MGSPPQLNPSSIWFQKNSSKWNSSCHPRQAWEIWRNGFQGRYNNSSFIVWIYLLVWIGHHLSWTNWPSWSWVCPTWSWGFPVNTSCIPWACYPLLWGSWSALGIIQHILGDLSATTSLFSRYHWLDPVISAVPDTVTRINNEQLPLLPELKELRGGDGVIGNAGNDDSDDHVCAEFTDTSESDQKYELGLNWCYSSVPCLY